MRVFVNNHPVEVYPGASVRHALLRYSETVYQDTVAGKLVVTDRHGNRLGLGGPLEEGLRLTVEGPGGYRPGPANPEVLAPAMDPASRNGKAAPGPSGGQGSPAGRGPGRPAANGLAGEGARPGGDGRRRRRGRRRGPKRRGRPRPRPEQAG